jgi:hypothetical protein
MFEDPKQKVRQECFRAPQVYHPISTHQIDTIVLRPILRNHQPSYAILRKLVQSGQSRLLIHILG